MRRDIKTGLTDSESISLNTIRIEAVYSTGKPGIGTGFVYRFMNSPHFPILGLVTNRHVVNNVQEIRLNFNPMGKDNKVDLQNVNKKIPVIISDITPDNWIGHPDPTIDLAVIPLNIIVNNLCEEGKTPYIPALVRENIPKSDEWLRLTALEPIVMVGYPSGIWDSVNNLPILRRGVTATHPKMDFLGKPLFLIDSAVFPGSSGSPVFLYDTKQFYWGEELNQGRHLPRLIGIMSEVYGHEMDGKMKTIPIPTVVKEVPSIYIPNNLGIVIKSTQLDAFELEFQKLSKKKNED